MKRILYALLLVSAPILSMQQDTTKETNKEVRGYGKEAAFLATLYNSIGTAAAVVIGIESLSTAVGTFFGMLPTP